MSPIYRERTDGAGNILGLEPIRYFAKLRCWLPLKSKPVGSHRELRPSENRHAWTWVPNRFVPAGRIVMCRYCAAVMQRTGGHTRVCYGAGRP